MYSGVLNIECAKKIIDVDKILTLDHRRSHEEWVRNSLRARQDEFGTVLDLDSPDEADEAQERCFICPLYIGAGEHFPSIPPLLQPSNTNDGSRWRPRGLFVVLFLSRHGSSLRPPWAKAAKLVPVGSKSRKIVYKPEITQTYCLANQESNRFTN